MVCIEMILNYLRSYWDLILEYNAHNCGYSQLYNSTGYYGITYYLQRDKYMIYLLYFVSLYILICIGIISNYSTNNWNLGME